MSEPPSELYTTWRHSYEEDSGDLEVYRHEGYDFPPARGRKGMEVRADGSFAEIPIGPDDRPGDRPGGWEFDEAGRELFVTFDHDMAYSDAFEIVELSSDVLKIRRRGAPRM